MKTDYLIGAPLKMNSLLQPLPDWHPLALCATRDPRDYDSLRNDPSVKAARSLRVCDGCPVVQACAAEACSLRAACYGSVRAGVSFSAATSFRGWQGDAVRLVAAGYLPFAAVVEAAPDELVAGLFAELKTAVAVGVGS